MKWHCKCFQNCCFLHNSNSRACWQVPSYPQCISCHLYSFTTELSVISYKMTYVQYLRTILVTWRMSYNSQELLTLHQHISSPRVLVGSVFSPAPRFTPGFGGVCVFTSTLVHPRGVVGSVLIIVLVFGVVRLCLFCFVLFLSSSCFQWIVHLWFSLRLSLTFIHIQGGI